MLISNRRRRRAPSAAARPGTRRGELRRGFTMIEILVGVVILGVLFALTAGAAVRYVANAKIRATEAMLIVIDDSLTRQMESFWRTHNPSALPHHFVLAGGAPAAT